MNKLERLGDEQKVYVDYYTHEKPQCVKIVLIEFEFGRYFTVAHLVCVELIIHHQVSFSVNKMVHLNLHMLELFSDYLLAVCLLCLSETNGSFRHGMMAD